MRKVVINNIHGGFGLSPRAVLKYAELSGIKVYPYAELERENNKNVPDGKERYRLLEKSQLDDEEIFIIYWLEDDLGKKTTNKKLNDAKWFNEREIPRDDENLVKVVQLMKKKANGSCADLKIVEIPDDVNWKIDEYDGSEWVAEEHRTWS